MGWFPMNKKVTVFLFLAALTLASAFCFAESDPPANRVSMSHARATALRSAPGKVRDFEFKIRNDQWVYFFKIIGKDHRVHRIVVDAVTGKVVSKTSEAMPVEANGSAASSRSPISKK